VVSLPCACVWLTCCAAWKVRKGGGWGGFKSPACTQHALVQVVDLLIKLPAIQRRWGTGVSPPCSHLQAFAWEFRNQSWNGFRFSRNSLVL
jgi:hypothetical protein